MKKNWLVWVSFLLIGVSSCVEPEETQLDKQAKEDDKIISDYLKSNKITAERDNSGYYYQVIESNPAGTPVDYNDVVSIYYKMYLINGALIDSITAYKSSPVRFIHSIDALVPSGLNYGISHMKTGETFRYYIPSYLAFGDYWHQRLALPAKAIIMMEVKLVKTESYEDLKAIEDDSIANFMIHQEMTGFVKTSSNLRYKKVADGAGAKPSFGQSLKLHYTRRYFDGTVSETTEGLDPVVVTIGLGTSRANPGLEEGLKLMQEGEKAQLIIPSYIAFGGSIQVIPAEIRDELFKKKLINTKVLPFSPLIYDVQIVDIF